MSTAKSVLLAVGKHDRKVIASNYLNCQPRLESQNLRKWFSLNNFLENISFSMTFNFALLLQLGDNPFDDEL